MSWSNKIVIVTGGASGIGKEICTQLLAKDAIVYSIDINPCSLLGEKHFPSQFCVTDSERINALVSQILEKHQRIDFLFNNAGVGFAGEITEILKEEWQKSFDINLTGAINGINAIYPTMKKQGFGHIINTSSIAGLIAVPLLTPYTMTKHAIVGLSGALRLEAKSYGVNVSVLCPGVTDTAMLDSSSRVNIRRYFSNWTRVPYSTQKIVSQALAQIERNIGIILVPKRMKILWWLTKIYPRLTEKICLKAIASERTSRSIESLK